MEAAPRFVDDKPPELVSALPVDPKASPKTALRLLRCFMNGPNVRSFCSMSWTTLASIFVASCFDSGNGGCPAEVELSLFETRVLDWLIEDALIFTFKSYRTAASSKENHQSDYEVRIQSRSGGSSLADWRWRGDKSRVRAGSVNLLSLTLRSSLDYIWCRAILRFLISHRSSSCTLVEHRALRFPK